MVDGETPEGIRVHFVYPRTVGEIPCETFSDTGLCPYGAKCRYSHGLLLQKA